MLSRIALAPLALAALALRAVAADTPGEGIDVQRYALTLRPDFQRRSLAGDAAITFRATSEGLRRVVLTANALEVDGASLDGAAVAVSRAEGVAFALPRPLRAGETATLAIAFHGTPARGLVFGPRSVVSSYFTCDWMFCAQDRPGDKAAFALTLLLPPGFASIGPGTLRDKGRGPDGLERHVWREDQPYSGYVLGFAAGAFASHRVKQDGATLLALGTVPPERLRALFAPTGDMVRFFSQRAGLPLPHRRYVQVLVPGDEAQEAATFSVLGEEVVAARLADPREDWAIAHELAHQWWGNRVTCRDWTHFWLNEGLASFMVAAWKEHRWGTEAYERELALFARRRETAARAGLDVPLTYPGPWPSLALRRAITYSKAALFLHRLRTDMGEAAFWRGLRAFTRAHAGGTVESRDFQRAMEEAAGRDLRPLFAEWVY